MTDLSRLKLKNDQLIKKLRAYKILTVEDLWSRVGEDFDAGIQRVSNELGISEAQLFLILARRGSQEAAEGHPKWLARHWMDLALLLVISIILMLTLRAFYLHDSRGWPALIYRNVTIVETANDLPAFHQISPGDVKEVRRNWTIVRPSLFQQESNVLGRFTLQALSSGTTLGKGVISSENLPDGCCLVTSIPVVQQSLDLPRKGRWTTLMFVMEGSEAINGEPPAELNVLVLDKRLEDGQGWIIAAVHEKDLDDLAVALSMANVYAIGTAR